MKCWGLRESELSADTEIYAEHKSQCKHQTPNILYMMLN